MTDYYTWSIPVPATEHRIYTNRTTHPHFETFQAGCVCGWLGHHQRSQEAADDEFRSVHVQTPPPWDPTTEGSGE